MNPRQIDYMVIVTLGIVLLVVRALLNWEILPSICFFALITQLVFALEGKIWIASTIVLLAAALCIEVLDHHESAEQMIMLSVFAACLAGLAYMFPAKKTT